MPVDKSNEEIKQAVKKHYAEAITQKNSSCCSPIPVEYDKDAAGRFVKLAGYSDEEVSEMPEDVTSFGCGNPVSFMDVKKGEVVLDLGSGSGLDLILAANKVGDEGKVIGLDMTQEMIETCRNNLERAGIKNAELRQGEIEKMPVNDSEVDWIISNCVINLSPDKKKVFAEAYRVLKPGGQMMISDIVTLGLPDEYRNDIMAWVGCIAGAVDEDEYIKLVKDTGFSEVEIKGKMIYNSQSLSTLANDACGCGTDDKAVDKSVVDKYADKVASVRLYAKKPE
ncbi:MAG: arsenite methyltransferase [Candidatus Zixiibacteriota bacterium]